MARLFFKKVLLIIGIVILSCLLIGPTTFADDNDYNSELNLTALLRGNASPVPTSDPCILINTETATGLALNIGSFKWESKEIVDVSSSPDCFNPEGAEIDGKFVITTADDSQIFGVYRTIAQIDSSTNVITALGNYEIKGGHGKFKGAEGKGIIKAVGDFFPPFEVTGELIGQISYDDD